MQTFKHISVNDLFSYVCPGFHSTILGRVNAITVKDDRVSISFTCYRSEHRESVGEDMGVTFSLANFDKVQERNDYDLYDERNM